MTGIRSRSLAPTLEWFKLTALYVADLDAIGGREMNATLVEALAGIAPLWVDAGASSAEQARHVIALGAAQAVAGSKRWPRLMRGGDVRRIGGDRVAFSLDSAPVLQSRQSPARCVP